MLDLQDRGCHNVELVSASHLLPQVLESLDLAAADGLRLPIVYNTNGYDSQEGLAWLDGVVDVYLPDAKYSEDAVAAEVSDCPDYVAVNRAALKEMHRQVGDLIVDGQGIATRGMILRLLVLPDDAAGCLDTLEWLAENLGSSVWLSIMSQYRPYHLAAGHPRIGRPLGRQEYEAVLSWVERIGFENYFLQTLESQNSCVPDFADESPFDFGDRLGAATRDRSR
jgi:putative pyruvate formate lyase activating enzyme